MSSESLTTTETAFTAVHLDIVRAHILTRLDGPALAALTCTSAQLSALAMDEDLWKAASITTWPSTSDPRVRDTVSSFTSGYRSLFSDSFPVLRHPTKMSTKSNATSSVELISAVDVYYKNEVIFSKVHVTELIESEWFQCSPFRADLLGQTESIPTRIRIPPDDDCGMNSNEWLMNHLEENLTLSWIIINPVTNQAANLSTRDPVSVHWVDDGDVQVRYSTDFGGSAAEIVVTLGGGKNGGEEVHVTEMSMQVEDMEGKSLSGGESLRILQAALDSGKRKKWERGQGKARFEEYEEMRRERKRRQQKREWVLDLVCVAVGVPFIVTFWTCTILSCS